MISQEGDGAQEAAALAALQAEVMCIKHSNSIGDNPITAIPQLQDELKRLEVRACCYKRRPG
jgi:hypothetical protein